MEEYLGLSPANRKMFFNKANTSRFTGFFSPKKEKEKELNFTRKETQKSKHTKINNKINENPNLQKANNKILNFITNCIEKIKDEKNEEETHITRHLAGVMEKQKIIKEHKKGIKKDSLFNREYSKKSLKPTKHKNMSCNSQIHIIDNNLNIPCSETHRKSVNNQTLNRKSTKKSIKPLQRIFTSRFAKEKEKEIVYNISSSLISLYKPNKMIIKTHHSNFSSNLGITCKYKEAEKSKFLISSNLKTLIDDKNTKIDKNSKIDRNTVISEDKNTKIDKNSKIKGKSRRDSTEEKFRSNFSAGSQIVKKPQHVKRYKTFIKSITHKNRIKHNKSNRKSSSLNKKNNEILNKLTNENTGNKIINQAKENENNIKTFEEKKKKSKIEKKNVLDWTNELKNREDLTQGEYIHIEQDLIQTLIGYEKSKLEEELNQIGTTETTDLIKRLPTINNPKYKSPKGKENFEDTLMNVNITELNLKDSVKFDKERFRLLQHTGYVYDSLDDEEAEDAIDINHYYIHPDSFLIYIFDSIIAILTFYALFYLPYYLAHDPFLNYSYFTFKIYLFHMIENFYIIDLIISFFRAYYNYDEILIKNVPDMSCNYLKNWFFLDLVVAIPFYSLFFYLEYKNIDAKYLKSKLNQMHDFTHYGVKLNKMHYLLFTIKLLKIFKCFSDNRAIYKLEHFLFKNNIIEEKSGIFFVIFILLASMHFGTSIFIFIGRNSSQSWINTIGIENMPFSSIYICSLYYLIATITTVGYGDVHGESIKEIFFQIILLIIGTCTYSYLISSVSNYIKKRNEKSLNFENKLKILNEIKLTNPHMQDQLYDKLLRFLRYKKNTEKNNQNIILNNLPFSLKNTLLIEMYKPIINNFMIFKGLENSNCIVQLVTAFKPIFAIKNDILIQEGDFIEEVIFIKSGIISLEIGIDFNKPKESIVQYLNRIDNKEKAPIQMKQNTKYFDTSIRTLNTHTTFFQNMKSTIPEKIDKNMHYLKVLDIRKNEHFGETLMFLNERSFLTVRVKSKKAELFFLKKEEVIKIFNTFPNIWNRINKKSIYNMKQIKMTVRKVLLSFCNMNGIILDKESNNDSKSFIKNPTKSKKKRNSKLINTIKEESKIDESIKSKISENGDEDKNEDKNKDNSINLSENTNLNEEIKEEKKDEVQSFRDLLMSTTHKPSYLLSNIEKFNNESLLNFTNNNNSNKNNTNSPNSRNNYSKNLNSKELTSISNNSKLIFNNFSAFKGVKNQSFNELGYNIDEKSKEYDNECNEISSKETVKISVKRKPCSLIDSDSLNEEKRFFDSKYEIKDEINSDENFNLVCEFKENLFHKENILKSFFNNNITIESLSKKILEKTWMKNLDKEKSYYLEKLFNKSSNSLLDKNEKKGKKNNLSFQSSSSSSSRDSTNLKNIHTESFEIMSSYENINELTNLKYIKSAQLRKKTKEFLKNECISLFNKINESRISSKNINKINESRISSKNVNKSTIYENRFNIKNNKSKKFDLQDINKSVIVSGRIRKGTQKIRPKGTMPNLKIVRRGTVSKINKSSQNNQERKRTNQFNQGQQLLNSTKRSSKNVYRFSRRLTKMNVSVTNDEKLNKSVILTDEEENKEVSFYDKFNTNRNNQNNEFLDSQKPLRRRRRVQDTELEAIRNIIMQDSQNLNDPSLYYQQLFLNQIQKRNNKETILPAKKSKNPNISNLNCEIKRTSTELKNNINNKMFSLKKNNYQRTSIIAMSKLKKFK